MVLHIFMHKDQVTLSYGTICFNILFLSCPKDWLFFIKYRDTDNLYIVEIGTQTRVRTFSHSEWCCVSELKLYTPTHIFPLPKDDKNVINHDNILLFWWNIPTFWNWGEDCSTLFQSVNRVSTCGQGWISKGSRWKTNDTSGWVELIWASLNTSCWVNRKQLTFTCDFESFYDYTAITFFPSNA